MSKNAKLLIIINSIRRIIDIFLGPFLTAYFFKLTVDNIKVISIYNILCYFIIMITSFIVGYIIKNKYKLTMFRFGMIMKLIQLIILVILGKNIINHLLLVAIISGISTITWAFPLNLFSSLLVDNKEKKDFVVYKLVFTNIINVIIPFIFGTLITINSFEKTLIIVLILSLIQIFLSFIIDYKEDNNNYKFNLFQEYKKLKKDNNVKLLFKSDLLLGLTSEGALDTLVTLMIILSFNSDFSLGIITSVSYMFGILSAYLCKRVNDKNIKLIVYIASIIPLICTVVLLFITNKYTIIGYNVIYAFFIQIISIIKSTKTLRITNSSIINDSNRSESYILFEFFLGLGRIISYVLLLIIGLTNNIYLLKILIIVLTSCIILLGRNVLRIKD